MNALLGFLAGWAVAQAFAQDARDKASVERFIGSLVA